MVNVWSPEHALRWFLKRHRDNSLPLSRFPYTISFPFNSIERQCFSVFGDGAFYLVRGSVCEIRVDFDADSDFSVRVGGEGCNDFFGDLN